MADWRLRRATFFLGIACAVATAGCGDDKGSAGPGGTTGGAGDGTSVDGSSAASGGATDTGGMGSTIDGSTVPLTSTKRAERPTATRPRTPTTRTMPISAIRAASTSPIQDAQVLCVCHHITAKFRGIACTAMLKDENRFGVRNYYDAIIDGGPPTKFVALPSQTEYPVASNLSNGEHTDHARQTNRGCHRLHPVLGFQNCWRNLAPPAAPTHRIEILGDSITCGSGDEAANNSAQCMEDGWGQPYQSSYLSYGAGAWRDCSAPNTT